MVLVLLTPLLIFGFVIVVGVLIAAIITGIGKLTTRPRPTPPAPVLEATPPPQPRYLPDPDCEFCNGSGTFVLFIAAPCECIPRPY